jgi:hypothetical protein
LASESATIVQRLWNYCHVLRDDGVSYGDYVEERSQAMKSPGYGAAPDKSG